MARIVDLIVKDDHGNWSSLGISESGEGVNSLIRKYNELIASAGIIKRGKQEVKLSEMRLLANKTSGGELKAMRKFLA